MRNLDISNWAFPSRGGFEIGLLLRIIDLALVVRVDVGEAGNPVYGAGTQVDGTGGFGVGRC